MEHGQDYQRFVCFAEVHGAWERLQQCSADVDGDQWKLQRHRANPLEHVINVT